ncbi:MAG: hypothetical protein IPM39_09230 [Chloroflexi bacterium]|nr:hypothetical protein [Chloroflexota bacterium]
MKLILSRKGFDAATGKVPSPILPSGQLCSLPIPDGRPERQQECRFYHQVQAGDVSLGQLVTDLTNGRITPTTPLHLDPDLDAASAPRQSGWRAVFGQSGAAESHLQRLGVGPGDIFLFFGWFRQVAVVDGRFRYIPNASDWHVLFGWLQVERRIPLTAAADIPPWAADHPHCQRRQPLNPDALYIARETLDLPGVNLPGGGLFPRFHEGLRLTDPASEHRSRWRLPAWFHPANRPSALSYHGRSDRWQLLDGAVQLDTVGRGQEFVLDADHYPEALVWLHTLFNPGRTA